jgi:hypothetical protein
MKISEHVASGAPDHILKLLRDLARKLNGLASGSVSARDGAMTAAPTSGTWAQGDFVENAAKTEAGTAGSKFVVQGWDCVAGGSPGTWVQRRTLTGN